MLYKFNTYRRFIERRNKIRHNELYNILINIFCHDITNYILIYVNINDTFPKAVQL